jgi:hypothetical protein
MRLLLSCIHFVETGDIKVSWDGKDRQFLLDVKNGKYPYDDLMKIAKDLDNKCKKWYDSTEMRRSINVEKVDEFVYSLYSQYWADNK